MPILGAQVNTEAMMVDECSNVAKTLLGVAHEGSDQATLALLGDMLL